MTEPKVRKKVNQNGKLNFDLKIKELQWTEKQKEFIELALNKKSKMILVKGAAGTSKTLLSVYSALQLLKSKRVSDIILVRNAIESTDNKLGFLKGGIEEKIYPYMVPFYDKLDIFLARAELDALEKQERIQAFPVGFLRGMDFQVKAVLLDEAQNCCSRELLTFMTRIGEFCKTFIMGDPLQSDIKNNGFSKVFDAFNNEESKSNGIFCFEFTEDDIMRSELCKYIVKIFKDIKG